jgi:hypothetical protein
VPFPTLDDVGGGAAMVRIPQRVAWLTRELLEKDLGASVLDAHILSGSTRQQRAYDAIVDRAIGWAHAVAGPSWGIRAKRTFVDLTDSHPLVTSEVRRQVVRILGELEARS